MIQFDANTILALLPVVGLAVLAMLVVAVDLAWPGRDAPVTLVSSAGIIVLMALVVIIGPFDLTSGHIGVLSGPTEVFGGAYVRDGLTALLDLVMLSIALIRGSLHAGFPWPLLPRRRDRRVPKPTK